MNNTEKEALKEALHLNGNNRRASARSLNMGYKKFLKAMKDHNINVPHRVLVKEVSTQQLIDLSLTGRTRESIAKEVGVSPSYVFTRLEAHFKGDYKAFSEKIQDIRGRIKFEERQTDAQRIDLRGTIEIRTS